MIVGQLADGSCELPKATFAFDGSRIARRVLQEDAEGDIQSLAEKYHRRRLGLMCATLKLAHRLRRQINQLAQLSLSKSLLTAKRGYP